VVNIPNRSLLRLPAGVWTELEEGGHLSSEQEEPGGASPTARRLSYKFQRLRERIRAAIEAGELVGKLPGERHLARQFNVNAKTLSKALTDLAAEGVLERNIGLGTFVRGAADAAPRSRLLLISDALAGEADPAAAASLVSALRAAGLDVDAHDDPADLPPSLLAPYDVVLVGRRVSEQTLRDLIVRGKTVITLDRVTTPYSTHALLTHTERCAVTAARRLYDLGHRRLMVVNDGDSDAAPRSAMAEALPDVDWRHTSTEQVAAAVREGYTAAVCVGPMNGARLLTACRGGEVLVPADLSITAFGRLHGAAPCDGQFVEDADMARAVADVVRVGLPHRPLTLWLTGTAVDAGTVGPPPLPQRADAGVAV
jgi:DNA-binding transcriptional regulator YhcF (GntR family)